MKKNIWIMNHYAGETFFDQGGRHYWLAKYLCLTGYSPIIFCANSQHGVPERYWNTDSLWTEKVEPSISVPYVFVRARTYMGNGKQRILNMIDFYRNIKKSAKQYAAQHGAPDVIYASSVHPLTLVAGIKLAKQFGVKCVCEVRDLWPESLIAYGIAGPHNPAVLWLRRLEKWIYTKADAVVFTAEGSYDYIKEQHWEKEVPQSKVFYINNGVDLELFDYNKEHFRVEDKDLDDPDIFKVVYTGSIRQVNNLGLLLDAAKAVKDPRVRFLIWGDGDERPMLEQRVKDENIGNVVFKGWVEKKFVPSIVSRADVNYIDPFSDSVSKYGISSNKLFEYFAAGKPILVQARERYNPVKTYHAGICLQSLTATDLAAQIDAFAQMDEAGYQGYCVGASAAAKEFDFKKLTDTLMNVIEGTAKG